MAKKGGRMKTCPICKKESNAVGPKILWNTKQKNKDIRGGDSYLTKIMCEDCYQKYKNGELKLNS